jgi:predicted nucleic acid-binding protein
MGGSLCAFLDASVLYPVSLRNLLMRLTLDGLYQARWSAHVHEEWMRSVLRDHPHIPPARLHDLRTAMDDQAEDSLVIGYEGLIETLHLPDPDDRHVLAAAIVARADVIVTCNLKHFPELALAPYHIEAQHPDRFIRQMLDLAPGAVAGAVRAQQSRLVNPPVTMPDLLALFEKLGLTESVAELRHVLKRYPAKK